MLVGSISIAMHNNNGLKNILTICTERSICFIFTASLLLSPFTLFIRKKYSIFLWITAVFSLFSMFNIWYFRMFNTVIPIEMYGEFQNLNGLGESIVALIRWSDIFSILLPVALIFVYYRRYRGATPAATMKSRLITVLTILGLSLIPYAVQSNSLLLGMGERDAWHSDASLIKKYGLLPVVVKSYIHSYKNSNTPLDRVRRAELDAYFYIRANRLDSLITSERHIQPKQNLIFILLESFNASLIDKQFEGKHITPTLFKLSQSATTLYCPKMKVPVPASSIAGQFSLLTGLFDIPHNRFVMENPNSAYQSIIKNLRDNRDNFVSKNILATERDFWRQDIVDASLGVDSLYGSIEFYNSVGKAPKTWMSDKNLFKYAQWHMKKMNNRSFYMMLVTLDMHSPYLKVLRSSDEKCTIEPISYPEELTTELNVYYQRAQLLDSYISNLIDYLKEAELYEQTMIVITSDHNAHLQFLPGVKKSDDKDEVMNTISDYVPLLIINSGREFKADEFRDKVVIQHQLYPTMLQLLSLRPQNYAGLCPSILDTTNYSDSDFEDVTPDGKLKEYYDISKDIIKGFYFK